MVKMTSDILNIVILAILLFGAIYSFVRWNTQSLRNKLRNIEAKARKYDALIEQIPGPDRKRIVVQNGPKQCGKPYVSPRPVENGEELYDFVFPMQLINLTNFSFAPKEVTIRCFCHHILMYEAAANKIDGAISISDLQKLSINSLVLYIPTESFRVQTTSLGDLSIWKLRGTIIYKLNKPMPYHIDEEVIEVPIERDYELDEETVSKLRMLGDVEK